MKKRVKVYNITEVDCKEFETIETKQEGAKENKTQLHKRGKDEDQRRKRRRETDGTDQSKQNVSIVLCDVHELNSPNHKTGSSSPNCQKRTKMSAD